ncbi:hypothetical protein HUJ04_008909 [Dendroctonus ponderosae]|nr:hypothetical protein HUJ04_008909 [Dendroctonus ponderosae]KAH1008885.1 hypothetical protein HUJ05_009387 [Dendroctonus ponderosae]
MGINNRRGLRNAVFDCMDFRTCFLRLSMIGQQAVLLIVQFSATEPEISFVDIAKMSGVGVLIRLENTSGLIMGPINAACQTIYTRGSLLLSEHDPAQDRPLNNSTTSNETP